VIVLDELLQHTLELAASEDQQTVKEADLAARRPD
jgi:hypothetical protein